MTHDFRTESAINDLRTAMTMLEHEVTALSQQQDREAAEMMDRLCGPSAYHETNAAPYISERIGHKLAADKDRMIRSELANLIGREVGLDEIVRRVTVQHTTSGAETYFLDGDPFLRFASPHIEIEDSGGRHILTARQDVLRI